MSFDGPPFCLVEFVYPLLDVWRAIFSYANAEDAVSLLISGGIMTTVLLSRSGHGS